MPKQLPCGLPVIGLPALVMTIAAVRWSSIVALILFAFAAIAATIVVLALVSYRAERNGQHIGTVWWTGLLAGLVIVSIPLTRWPLRLAVAGSMPTLSRLMNDAEAGRLRDKPIMAGFVPILGTTRVHGTFPAIVLHDDPSGGTYLLRGDSRTGSPWETFTVVGEWRYFDED